MPKEDEILFQFSSKLNENKKELIVCIINNGYSDLVMSAAKKEGARGGTIIHGRGTGNADAEKFFGIKISPEKEVVLIVAYEDIKDRIVSAIYEDAGLDTKGQGIIFTLPIEDFVAASSVQESEE